MKKILLVCLSIFSTASFAQQLPPIHVNVPVKAWVIMDYDTGEILADYNGKERLEPASVTKVMTSYLIAEALDKGVIAPDAKVSISPYAQSQEGSRMFAEAGTQITVHDLVLGLVIQSGNDSSIALAEYLRGSEPNFAVEMNKKAKELGMNDTNFMNASGLPHPNHYSSAYDLAVLSRHLIQDFPDHYEIYSHKSFTWNGITQKNRNTLLWTDPSVDGIKTGHTRSAGYNLASSAIRNGFRVIVVVLGTNSEKERAQLSTELLNYAFMNFEHKKLYDADQVILQSPIHEGESNSVNLVSDKNIYITYPRGQYDNLRASVEVKKPLIAPVEKGQKIGEFIVKNGTQTILNTPLYAQETVEQASFMKRYWDQFKYKFQNKFQKLKAQIM
ncbi:D-alanyl-D-alanine carboxypeptidase [Wohlfahrtiimonas chitiniclastica]|uniref:serine-type D-Ala-D-Ala carboxypeptidase n=1 Tax=Wohlfahrtiimonas chitiniclastica TaxID=400946 RepID=A0A162D2S1_9GAMM|nr:D-alanyl-D-alanine carboxypeptidase family protein [Wohlfahrtiimonas chitiniclastica]KZS23069.1 D-alanyl-D-alanine carboxypeptidase [Wohlfahrtiimonas chitiniclastica]MBS7817547.1 D-alanyl-D-alanine carboxypeptidase [Wohlfahrtiimonas chitiniclastica]MBS7821303.1 D-alanyl-D-alanine carboxypeptidase [Wohlfahrtiimonas chitiniclastica]MBS7823392.1 D-alanyl-D-alanine carboxypeptidase [Wohlfahrtiimonas chitiniclastica]MBS7824404.1 D-alanyl-D-alanine carboxypeptidase [Wohlfahrtiimonas chitiniclasti